MVTQHDLQVSVVYDLCEETNDHVDTARSDILLLLARPSRALILLKFALAIVTWLLCNGAQALLQHNLNCRSPSLLYHGLGESVSIQQIPEMYDWSITQCFVLG